MAVTAVRTQGRATRTPGKRTSGDRGYRCLVGRIQVVAEGVPAQRLPVAAFEVVLRRVAVSVPSSVQQPARSVRHHVAGIKSHGACRIALKQFRKRGKNAWTFLLHFCQSLFKMDSLEDGWIRINYPIQYYWQVQAVCL